MENSQISQREKEAISSGVIANAVTCGMSVFKVDDRTGAIICEYDKNSLDGSTGGDKKFSMIDAHGYSCKESVRGAIIKQLTSVLFQKDGTINHYNVVQKWCQATNDRNSLSNLTSVNAYTVNAKDAESIKIVNQFLVKELAVNPDYTKALMMRVEATKSTLKNSNLAFSKGVYTDLDDLVELAQQTTNTQVAQSFASQDAEMSK